ncbi:hypothetical protein [Streptosporangium sp. NPDC051022]|uniref:hypothetical protein n=1 Tax=Streptosporangium sp. NPDC051022 TaxID=3155752 RepID=UPI00341DA14B
MAITAAVCGMLAAGPVACGGTADPGGERASAELARLRGLLREEASELPDGFSARSRDGWVPPFKAADNDCQLLFDTAGGMPSQRGRGTWVAVTYPGDRVGELAGVSLASYTPEDARLRFTRLTQALNGCRIARTSLAGRSTSLRVSGLNLDAAGADVQARRLHGRLNGYPYEIHMVFALAGHTLVSLVHAGVAGVDAERTGQIARSLIGRAAL